jgi:hypothetical protein
MNLALDFLGLKRLGPRGGDLDMPVRKPERRQSHFNSPNGLNGLHRFEQPETAEVGLKNEQPWHRMAAYMLNAGRTNSEVAAAAQRSVAEVTGLRAQRWFQELCATVANNFGEELIGLLQSEAAASIEMVVNLRDTAESERVQLAAAQLLIEHARGKPTQTVISDVTHRVNKDPREERAELLRELAEMNKPAQAQLVEA